MTTPGEVVALGSAIVSDSVLAAISSLPYSAVIEGSVVLTVSGWTDVVTAPGSIVAPGATAVSTSVVADRDTDPALVVIAGSFVVIASAETLTVCGWASVRSKSTAFCAGGV